MFPMSEGKKKRKRDKMKSSLQGVKLEKSEVIERRKRGDGIHYKLAKFCQSPLAETGIQDSVSFRRVRL